MAATKYSNAPSIPTSLVLYEPSGEGKVDYPSEAWLRMAKKWDLISDLLGGTLRMREVGQKWLPLEEAEESRDYGIRLKRSFLYEAYKDTGEKLLSKPFSQPVRIEGKAPAALEGFEKNVDLEGTDLTTFASEVFRQALRYGVVHVLVDFPAVRTDLTLADEQDADVRPYLCIVPASRLIGWQSEPGRNGIRRLTQIRIREWACVKDGVWGERFVEQVRVIAPDTWELWKRPEGEGEYTLAPEDQGPNSFGEIPLVTLNLFPTGFLEADPPLESIAWLNLAHWQSTSDQRNIVHMIRVPMLFAPGSSPDDEEIVVGSRTAIRAKNPDARLQYVEHGGAAVLAGQKDIDWLESMMQVLGLQPYLESTANITATAQNRDESKTVTSMQSWIRLAESALEQCWKLMAKWKKVELEEDFHLDIFDRFSIGARASTDMPIILQMFDKRLLQPQTVVEEAKRRNLLSDVVDPEDEVESAVDASAEALLRLLPKVPPTGGPGEPSEPEDEEAPKEPAAAQA